MERGKQTILIVDDTPQNIEILNEVLGDEYEILCATEGKEGLALALAEQPDLILLDVMMPEMDGYEMCRQLKEEPRTRAIPVIFITAMSQEDDEAKGLEIGAIDYLTKPISPPIVRARVRNHLELKRHRDILESISHIDGLTGIANRRQFDRVLDQEWRRAIRTRTPISLVMMDIDCFKEFNDCYGHLAGDDCLKSIAAAFDATLNRPGDLIARYGGEEFACILPETDASGARQVAERLHAAVLALCAPHRDSAVANQVTISVGVATMIPAAASQPDQLIAEADRHLYLAKKGGRNRICSLA